MSRIDVAIVFPVYESEALIGRAVSQVCHMCDTQGIAYEVVLCDDGSSDGSRRVLSDLCRHNSRVRVLINDRNYGLGYTLRRLLGSTAADYVVYCDLDLPFGAEGVMRVIEQRMAADVMVASRYAGELNHVVWWRRVVSRCYWMMCRMLFRIPVRDIGSGTVGLSRCRVQSLNLQADGFDIHAELYVKAARAGLTIREIALPSHPSPCGTFSVFRHARMILINTLKFRFCFADDSDAGRL